MRLRNIKNKEEIIKNSPYIVENSEEYKGKWSKLFNNNNPIYIEIGMGMGKFIRENAIKHPDINFIGIEKEDKVLARSLPLIKENIDNLKILRLNALEIDKVFANEIDNIYNKIVISNDMKENIKSAHDYIINNTKYNVNDEKTSIPTDSSTAIGVFFNGLATCNGYTDAMALLLDKMNISNVRISNDSHIWNLVKIDDKWLHLDLTWDDPINI